MGPGLPLVGTRLSANRKRVEAKHLVFLHIMDIIGAVILFFMVDPEEGFRPARIVYFSLLFQLDRLE